MANNKKLIKKWLSFDYSENVEELYLLAEIKHNCVPVFKYYDNTRFLYLVSSIDGSASNYDWIGRSEDINNFNNGDIIPVVCYQTANTSVKVGDIVGYVVLKDKDSLKTKSTSAGPGAEVLYPFCSNPFNFKKISEFVLENKIKPVSSDIDFLKGSLIKTVTYGQDSLFKALNYTIVGIGSKAPINSIPLEGSSDSSAASQLIIPISKGDILKLKFRTLSNWHCCAWAILDKDYTVLKWDRPYNVRPDVVDAVDYQVNYLDTPLIMNIEEEKAAYLCVFVTKAYFSTLSQFEVTRTFVSLDDSSVEKSAEVLKISMPDNIYAVEGDILQLFYRGMFRCVNPYIHDINTVCEIGTQFPRYFELNATTTHIGEHTLKVSIKDNNNNVIDSKDVKLIVSKSPVSPSKKLNVLCVGASATAGGQWASELKRRLTGAEGSPSGRALTNINFVGRKNITYKEQEVNLEATGGFDYNSYLSLNKPLYVFNFTSSKPCGNLNIGDSYSYDGNNFIVSEINLTEGVGNISCTCNTSHPFKPASDAILTKISGTGDQSINFASCETKGNPFVYDGKIDLKPYVDSYCEGKVDIVFTELFGNGSNPYIEDFEPRFNKMMEFIKLFTDINKETKFCIGLMWPPSLQGGMGSNYGASGTWSLLYGMKYSFMNLCDALQKYIIEKNLQDYVYIVNWLNEFDEENSYPSTTKPVNIRSNITEKIETNGVHPIESGYFQLADAAYRLFVNKFLQ